MSRDELFFLFYKYDEVFFTGNITELFFTTETDFTRRAALQSTLLLPPHGNLPDDGGGGSLPPARFGLHLNGALWGGWVRQSSPACAAASVAGAWNALAIPGGRHGPGALRQDDVLAHLKKVLEEQIAAKRARFERLLGFDIKDFEAALDDAIAADPSGKTLGGKSKAEPGFKRAEVMRLAVKVAKSKGGPELEAEAAAAAAAEAEAEVEAEATSSLPPPPAAASPSLTCFGAIAKLIRENEADGMVDEEDAAEGGDPDDEDANEPNDENNSNNKGGDDGVAAGGSDAYDDTLADALAAGIDMSGGGGGGKKTKKKASLSSTRWDWRKDFWDILKKRGGLEKLNRPKPSTGEFGNWGIIEACQRVSAAAAAAAAADPTAPPAPAISCKVVVGTKTKARKNLAVVLSSRGDQLAAADKEWAALRDLFARDDVALIFHLKNHYALIYALREQTDHTPAPTHVPTGTTGTETGGDSVVEGGGEEDEMTADVPGQRRRRRRREILTARRGQRPTTWIPWEEARETMLRWTGYGIMAVQLTK